jgi:hypothetical protein
MNTIRLLLVAALAVGLSLFSFANWRDVVVKLWPGYELVLPLPLLILGILALVYLPMALWIRAQRVLSGARIGKLEASLAKAEADLSQARVELLRPPSAAAPLGPVPPQAIPQAAPPPGS